MSISVPLAPKRRRGHLRVAAILQAAEELFAEKGYDAATMTEIAARSKTAIGSLYRFFPNKEVLADALLTDYVERVMESLDAIADEAAGMTPRQLAEALVAYRLRLKAHRKVAFVLLDAGSGLAEKRGELGAQLRERLVAALCRAFSPLDEGRARTMARVTQHMLKLVSEAPAEEDAVVADVTDLLESYFTRR